MLLLLLLLTVKWIVSHNPTRGGMNRLQIIETVKTIEQFHYRRILWTVGSARIGFGLARYDRDATIVNFSQLQLWLRVAIVIVGCGW